MNTNTKVAVLGGGSFGTVLANIAASNGYKVSLWVRDSEQALRINSEGANSSYHPELQLSPNILASEKLEDVMESSSVVFIATPSVIFETIMERIKPMIEEGSHIISCTKGIKLNPFRSMSDIISMNIDSKKNHVGVLSGPNLAREIAENKIAGTVIASSSNELIRDVKSTLSSDTFKVYSSNDLQGVELAGALKNIYAIICGMADSLNVGENAVGLILTRSMAEMSRFAVAKGANPITFLGLSGMGDLVATCTSGLSRNYQLGSNLGQGMSLQESKDKVGQVAEGIRTLEVIKEESSRLNIKMPLVDSLYNIIYKESSADTLINDLVNNPNEVDVEFQHRGN
ncbi:NAD(P)-dependent glycerol-3-phosphate dehydrogenase [Gammaproteobacteria bacterium]|jgi:glycerol-3-phosphate dehydrogenase (NAD(P)+)|nr:NAD(P)-dependent glycerol-3-phosphate dehydrogenase [Gammaproteobacteria bacterium]MDA7829701.1 NAD(P)-dependent glycerol-3-phosphate dehydrogenase [Gammaproteobacteria bacterium]MDA7843964.1 NAD(P)-dependent glycerol-3-phosphate dehydrogenase [Gammaproteobacteria bacterium]MDA8955464.1 NAD(P)-dependent glycerol-3-phosphate dehydrogenase [Gammaproteobacteria bacterium]MDA9040039.1 NAD(P)-dependent glycerol-3-phosphate dehydrogenase [Gammaproteobacteria bacterium]